MTINNCTADQGGAGYWRSGNFPFSYQVADSSQNQAIIDRNITFNDCIGSNNYHEYGTGYWNGDTFCAESASDYVTYNRCMAFNNTDGGWDVKTRNTYLNDCVALGNKRAFRFWSAGEAVMTNCIGAYSKTTGGMPSSCGVWSGILTTKAQVYLYDCTIYNNDGVELYGEGGDIYAYNSIIAEDRDTGELCFGIDGGVVTTNGCDLYLEGVSGTNPQFVNGSNYNWNGFGTDFNSLYYGSGKGYYQAP
jgi:hypothetical protein